MNVSGSQGGDDEHFGGLDRRNTSGHSTGEGMLGGIENGQHLLAGPGVGARISDTCQGTSTEREEGGGRVGQARLYLSKRVEGRLLWMAPFHQTGGAIQRSEESSRVFGNTLSEPCPRCQAPLPWGETLERGEATVWRRSGSRHKPGSTLSAEGLEQVERLDSIGTLWKARVAVSDGDENDAIE